MLNALPFLLIALLAAINKAKVQQNRRGNQTGIKTNQLEKKLLAMLNGDRAGANRLLKGTKRMYPGKSNEWYFEKVIADLERDRR